MKTETETASRQLGLAERREFMKLTLEERRRQMADQAAGMVNHYEDRTESGERGDWQGGDIVE